jgi:hypothetical protein
MKCPICETIDLKISERRGIEIDYCPRCRGVWLDRGELDKIIERSAQEAGFRSTQPSDYRYERDNDDWDDHDPRYRHPQGKPKRRSKSVLEEIFDIF